MTTIAEKLLQLNETKQAIKTAIEDKGQDLTNVPFTDYASKISEIVGGKKITTGTVTFATANSVQTITHNLGVVPSLVAMWVKDLSIIPPTRTEEAKGNVYKFTHSYIPSGEIDYGSCYQGNTGTGALGWTWSSLTLPVVNETTFKTGTSANGYKFMANVEYEWIVME